MAMIGARAQELYDQHVRELPLSERLWLLALLASDLATEAASQQEPATHDIMELDGLGKEIWDGVDGQEYVRRLRAGESLPRRDSPMRSIASLTWGSIRCRSSI